MAIRLLLLLFIGTTPLYGLQLIEMEEDIRIPNPSEVAKMARYIIHNSDWASIATISTLSEIQTYPFVSLKSVSDGPRDNSTGNLYFYITSMDVSGKDITVDNRVTIMATLAESSYCSQNNLDPQDPRCAKVIISGHFHKVDNATSPEEYKFARASLFERHPAMKYWPIDHNWYIGKIDINLILVLDFFGGIKNVSIEDYFNANITSYNTEHWKVSVIDIPV
ncbi:hypothetical protein ILUMI_06480 [Ignelater luminosus]|uniref:CREG-like beta-barrel domain-containing protein n=1 Tax=Ignelater luminosus TaxID=2038154 RepID=A0A8K0DFF5_IGNLU|nr:hypothetical protein ILUMI_06480 [Ignelater luminosus]